jgi:rubredoxin
MLTYSECIELREKLLNGKISLELAKELYWKDYKEGQRSWHTKDWKERRAKIIKEKCEICDSSDTLTIQHRSHPKKYTDYEREITRKYTQIYRENNSDIDKSEFKKHIVNNYDYIAIPLCVNCGDNRPKKRVRKLPQYRCAVCQHEFDEPIYKSLEELITIFYTDEDAFDVREKCFVSKDNWKNNHNLSNIKYWFQREKAKTKDGERIRKEAFLLYLTDDIKYLSFSDTLTACKRCASNYDLNNMELCPNCKVNYKSIQYPTCILCLPEDKRKAALEMIEFGKEWHKMHKELGID